MENGSTYVGSAADLTRRLRDYFSPVWLNKEVLKHTSIIYRALLKYGYSKFRLEILEYCDKSETIQREQYYLNVLKPTYNICTKAGSSLGRKTSDSVRSKLKKAFILRLHRSRQSTLELGEFYIEYILEKLSKIELRIFRLQKELDSFVAKKSEISRFDDNKLKPSPTAKSIIVLNLKTGESTSYPSARSAALVMNTSHSIIMNKLKNPNSKAYKGRYVIRGCGSSPGLI